MLQYNRFLNVQQQSGLFKPNLMCLNNKGVKIIRQLYANKYSAELSGRKYLGLLQYIY